MLAVLGLGAAWLARQLSPLEIARWRLAVGEITTAEFEEIWNRLRR